MEQPFSIFDDKLGCHDCGKPCCGGSQTDPAQWPKYALPAGELGALIGPSTTVVTDTNTCLHGTGGFDPTGTWRCPSGADLACPSGQHIAYNYAGEQICAPVACPPGQHMGYSTDGRRVICADNDPAPAAQCPPGTRLNAATGACIPVAASTFPGGTPGPVPASSGDSTIFGLSPLMFAAVAAGGIFLLSSMGGKGK